MQYRVGLSQLRCSYYVKTFTWCHTERGGPWVRTQWY